MRQPLHILFLWVLFFLCSTNLSAIESEKSYMKSLAEKNLEAFGWEDNDWDAHGMRDFLNQMMKQKFNPTIKHLRARAWGLFINQEEHLDFKNSALIDPSSTWNDLNLFCGQEERSVYVGEKIARTETELGKASLFLTLSAPVADSTLLKARQNVVKAFLANETLFSTFDTSLKKLRVAEPVVLSFYHNDALRNTVKNFLEFNGDSPFLKSLNKDYIALDIRSGMSHLQRVQWLTLSVVSAAVLLSYGLIKLIGKEPPAHIEHWANSEQGGIFSLQRLAWNSGFGWLKTFIALSSGSYVFSTLKPTAEWVSDCYHLERCVHSVTSQLALFMNNARKLYQELNQCSELALFEEIKPIKSFFEDAVPASSELSEFVELLQEDTFSKPFTAFTHRGHVIRAYTLMHELKGQLAPLLMGVGKLDAYYSVAKLMKEFQNKRIAFCFPTYLAADTPLIELTDFWHPLLNEEQVVTNSITIGGKERSNIILTGPNAGGKSTTIKAITLLLLLAQTIGIAPAQEMRFTPFNSIKTYLNIVDDIGRGNSLFMAEARQAQSLIDRVENQPKNEFSFICFDEVFNGTSPVEGAAAAYSVAHHLAPYKNNICIVATHFPLLTRLENDTATFKNYKVSVVQDNGLLEYPFKLEAGISHQHVALDVLKQQGFAGSLLETAKEMIRAAEKQNYR